MVTVKAHIGTILYKTEIKTEQHTLISDEPEAIGGGDLGFSPDELLAAALSACTTTTLRMYANRKGWTELEAIDVEVIFERLNNNSNMNRKITLTGNITEEQRERLLYIANRCPVHQTLSHPIVIDTTIS